MFPHCKISFLGKKLKKLKTFSDGEISFLEKGLTYA